MADQIDLATAPAPTPPETGSPDPRRFRSPAPAIQPAHMTTLPADRLRRARPSLLALGAQFVRFSAVGATNTLVTFGTYALLLAAGLPYLGALVPAFALGALNGYTLNRAWTFRAGAFQRSALARYVAAQLSGLGLNALLLVLCVEELHTHRLIGELVAIPIVSLVTFAASRYWVFASHRTVGTGHGPMTAAPSRSGSG
jgi:putative flippase GtrA